MKKLSFFLIFIIIVGLSAGVLFGQAEMKIKQISPKFHFDVINSAPPENFDQSRLTILLEVVYDELLFIKIADGFEATYEMTAVILKGNDQVAGKIWEETVRVDDYQRTNSRSDVSLSNQVFDVEPGKYKVRINFNDTQSKEKFKAEAEVKANDFSENHLSAGAFTFARKVEFEDDKVKSILPDVTNPYKGLSGPSNVYFEIYNPENVDSVQVNYKAEGQSSSSGYKDSFPAKLTGERTALTFQLPVDSLNHDKYKLTIKVSSDDKNIKLVKPFYVRWQGLPRNAEDLETAIKQAHYTATNKEWKKLKKAPKDKKLEVFKKFWKKKDPTPTDSYNEAMDKYYTRVGLANRHFSVMGREGWQTDRGMLFIILGPPDNIIRNDYPSNSKPYQIWQYYSINRQFEFYDDTGFGDFELVYPISIYEIQRYAHD